MINPTQVATVVIAAMLFTAAVDAGLDPAAAGPIPAPGEAAAAAPKSAAPATGAKSHARAVTADCHRRGAASARRSACATAPPRGRVYLFRGALGPIFSRGMDSLTEKLEQAGITASVNEFTICRLIAAKAVREYREDPAPIILIGHSMGGLCTLIFAEILQDEEHPGQPGSSPSIQLTSSPNVPLNVERYHQHLPVGERLGWRRRHAGAGLSGPLRELRSLACMMR